MIGRTAWSMALLAGIAAAVAGGALALAPADPLATHPAYAWLNLQAAWDVTTGSPEVVIAVIDTGVDRGHPDLAGAVLPGHDFVDGDEDASDPPGFGHGTAVAGIAAARAGNGLGGVGACFGCSILPLRVVGPDGFALNTDTAAAIDYAVDHGAAVVNASLYGERSPQVLRNAVARARASGVLVVAAAGNEGTTRRQYPAAFPEAISVAAADNPGELAAFSSRGDWVKVAGPACAPLTTLDGGFGEGCATSVSTPLVAGVVALLRAQAPYATAAQLQDALTSTARTVPGTRYGLVDAGAALQRLGNPEPRLAPAILGDPVVGETLEAVTGVWSGAKLDVSSRWERCRGDTCSPISGATASTYEATASDAGSQLRVVLSSPRAAEASATTAPVAARPKLVSSPTIAGRPRVGARLVARFGAWEGTDLRYSVTWVRCRESACTPVSTGTRYAVGQRDRGRRLLVEVTATNRVGALTVRSRPTDTVR